MKHALLDDSFLRRCLAVLLLAALPLMGGCQTVKTVKDTAMQSDLIGTVGQLTGNETLAMFNSERISALGESLAAKADSARTVAPPNSRYSRRLDTLAAAMTKTRALSGKDFNFEVYLSDTLNAFATPDGSIRVFSGLMDKLDDGELRFVLAHEVGHVTKGHLREKLLVAVGTKSLRDLAAQQGGTLEDLATGRIGQMASSLAKAQFSQKEEREADDFALKFMADQGYDIRKAPSALKKLVPSGGSPGQAGGGLFASHPAPQERAQRMREQLQSVKEYRNTVTYHERLDNKETQDASAEDAPDPSDDPNASGEESAGEREVERVQRALSERGYACGPADGVMGPKTRSCIRSFQKANGLQPSGELNPATRRMLQQIFDAGDDE